MNIASYVPDCYRW